MLMQDPNFILKLNNTELRAWNSFEVLCKNFLGNYKNPDYVAVVHEFLTAYSKMNCNMSIKIHFLHSHLDFFPHNLGKYSDEQGERFHQELAAMEKRFEGKNRLNMITKYCWSLKRATEDTDYIKKRPRQYFQN